MQGNVRVLSVGGSIVAPDQPDKEFIVKFVGTLVDWLQNNPKEKLMLVIGGGGPARTYQQAYHDIVAHLPLPAVAAIRFDTKEEEENSADWIGITATRMNAELIRAVFCKFAESAVVIDPTHAPDEWTGRVLIAAGWKPGFSTDFIAVTLAEKYEAKTVVNLSNTSHVYDKDPNEFFDAKPLDRVSWKDFRKIVGTEWKPGLNMPFDPIASARAEMDDLTVICANGHDIENTLAILNGAPFTGTTISGRIPS